MAALSLLIVEDNPGDVLLIKEHLNQKKGFHYRAMEAVNLDSARDILSRHEIDVVLLDLALPDSSGLETVRKVVSDFPTVPLIVLTGLQDEKTARLAVRYGAQDYLNKESISAEYLARSIIYAIERKKISQDKEELLADLTRALEKIEKLEESLPMCVNCKKIFDGSRKWQSIEEYIKHRSKINFVPLICPECRIEIDWKPET